MSLHERRNRILTQQQEEAEAAKLSKEQEDSELRAKIEPFRRAFVGIIKSNQKHINFQQMVNSPKLHKLLEELWNDWKPTSISVIKVKEQKAIVKKTLFGSKKTFEEIEVPKQFEKPSPYLPTIEDKTSPEEFVASLTDVALNKIIFEESKDMETACQSILNQFFNYCRYSIDFNTNVHHSYDVSYYSCSISIGLRNGNIKMEIRAGNSVSENNLTTMDELLDFLAIRNFSAIDYSPSEY